MGTRQMYVVFVEMSATIEVEAESCEEAKKQVLEELRYKDARMLDDWNDPIAEHAISAVRTEHEINNCLDIDDDEESLPKEHGNAIYDNATIAEVRRLGEQGLRQIDIAERTGLSQPYISQLLGQRSRKEN